MTGCSKKEDSSIVEDETVPESSIQAPEQELPEQPISPLMEQYLKESISHLNVTAGYPISTLFDLWKAVLHHKGWDIYIEVEAEGKTQKDRVWKNKTRREILDEYCQDNELVWKITGPNTIQIRRDPTVFK